VPQAEKATSKSGVVLCVFGIGGIASASELDFVFRVD